jgi:hypothetical protein
MSPALARRLVAPVLVVSVAATASAQPPSAGDLLSRFTARDAAIASYSVPVHVDVRLRKIFPLRFGFNGMQYYKRPGKLALELKRIPAQYAKLFAEIGTPLTWRETYDLRVTGSSVVNGQVVNHVEGTPKHPEQVARVALDVPEDTAVPLRGTWYCRDGTPIAMVIEDQGSGVYDLPKRAQVDISVSGFRIHANLDYGTYAVNTAVADSVFGTSSSY